MSEQLDKIRAEMKANLNILTCASDTKAVKEGARMCLELLDEYERRLVKIEGVNEAYEVLGEGMRVNGADDFGVRYEWANEEGFVLMGQNRLMRFSAPSLREFLSGGLAALMCLEGK